jgi:hypothetical protein
LPCLVSSAISTLVEVVPSRVSASTDVPDYCYALLSCRLDLATMSAWRRQGWHQDRGGARWWAARWVKLFGVARVVVFWGSGEMHVSSSGTDKWLRVSPVLPHMGVGCTHSPLSFDYHDEILELVQATTSLSHFFLKVLLGTTSTEHAYCPGP